MLAAWHWHSSRRYPAPPAILHTYSIPAKFRFWSCTSHDHRRCQPGPPRRPRLRSRKSGEVLVAHFTYKNIEGRAGQHAPYFVEGVCVAGRRRPTNPCCRVSSVPQRGGYAVTADFLVAVRGFGAGVKETASTSYSEEVPVACVDPRAKTGMVEDAGRASPLRFENSITDMGTS